MAASVMSLQTRARGRQCSFILRLRDLANVEDIEQLKIDFQSESCDPELNGTTITLSDLHQGLVYPNASKLRQVLLQDYGRQDDFIIVVDGKQLDVDDLSGSYVVTEEELPSVGKVRLRFSLSHGKNGLHQPGITLRVDGKSVGRPGFFGLDERDDFPKKLLRKLFGEIEADGLRDHITASWDAPVENSELLKIVEGFAQPILRNAFSQQYRREIQLAQARLQRNILKRLASLPEHKRSFADRAIKKVLDKYYGEPESKVEPIVYVLLEALERSDYRLLLEHIADAKPSDVAGIADNLYEFGLADMAFLVQQATARQVFLDQLEALARDSTTTEAILHKALERNLWVLGNEYSLFSSNTTLRRQIEDLLGKIYTGKRSDKRPDLLLNENLSGEYLLIEFKRPSHPLNRDDYIQATNYRHDLFNYLNPKIKVLLIGGRRSPDFPIINTEPQVETQLYNQIISTARKQIEWLLRMGKEQNDD